MAESKEELKSLLMKVKEESEKAGLKFSIQKKKIMASSPISSVQLLSSVQLFEAPLGCSTLGFLVCRHLPELAQTHVHSVGDVIQPSGPHNFMAAATICSDFGAQENKVCHHFHCFPIYLP